MVFLLHPFLQFIHRGHRTTICDTLDQIGDALTRSSGLEFICHGLFEHAAHPHHTLEAAICRDKLGADQVELAHPHHTWGLQTAAGDAGQRAEGHPCGGHSGVFTADDHYAVHFRDHHHDAFEAAAGRHRVFHDRVHGDLFDNAMRTSLGVLVGAFPITSFDIDRLAQLDGLVRAGRVDAKGGLAIQPVISAAQPQAFWADHTHVVGCKGLAQRAGIELFHPVVGQIGQAFVAKIIRLAGLGQPFLHLFRIGVDGHLHLIHDGAEIVLEAGMQNLAEVFQVETFFGGAVRDADPGDIALSDMLDARSAVDKVMDLALQHRLEIFLHLAAGHLDDDAHIHGPLRRHIVEFRADDIYFAVDHFVQRRHVQILEAARILTAELDAHIRLAHHFAFESRAVRHRHRHFGQFDLHTAHLDALLHQAFGLLQIVLTVDLFERQADHVLVARHTRGQDLRDDGIRNYREAIVDRPGCRGILQIIHLAQRQHKGKHTLPVVEQDVARLSRLETAKGQRRAGSKAQGINGAERIRTKRHGVGIVPQFDALFGQLVDDAAPIHIPREESEDVALLQFAHDLDRHLVRLGRTHNRRKPRHTPIHQLDTPGAQLDIIDRAIQMPAITVPIG